MVSKVLILFLIQLNTNFRTNQRRMSVKDFQILTKLGDGAYSTVYKVLRHQDNKIYALKRVKMGNLSPKQKENALNQIRILASIKHPNIVAYRDAFIDDASKSLCIVMEYASQGDLARKITEQQNKSSYMHQSEIWNIFVQIVRGLGELHRMNIFHRDIKPANVFLHEGGVVKLGDMNVSKITERGFCMTQTGTPYYASPEVWKDEPYDEKSDIWSLGCVLYEIITLKPPFRAEDMEGLFKKVTRGIYQRLPHQYSQDLSTVIRSLLQTNSQLRPSCAKLLNLQQVQKRTRNSINSKNETERSQLLKTIRGDNMYSLGQMLPKSNYHQVKIKKAKGVKSLIQSLQEKQMCEVESLPTLDKDRKIPHGEHSDRISSKDKVSLMIRDRKKSEVGSSRSGLQINGLNCRLDDSKELKLPRVQHRYQKARDKLHKQSSLKAHKL